MLCRLCEIRPNAFFNARSYLNISLVVLREVVFADCKKYRDLRVRRPQLRSVTANEQAS
jgi:hypothetical protein